MVVQESLQKKSKKDYSNIFKEIKGKRKIKFKQAIEYSKALNCDPAKLLFEETNVKYGEL